MLVLHLVNIMSLWMIWWYANMTKYFPQQPHGPHGPNLECFQRLPKRQPWRLQGSTACLRKKIDSFPVWKTSRRFATTKGTPAYADVTWCDHGMLVKSGPYFDTARDEKSVDEMLVLSQVFPVKNQTWKKRVRIEQSQASTWLFLVLFWFYLISHDRPLWFCSAWSPFI